MKRGFYGDKHEVQLALESTAFPGDQDSGMQDMHQTRNLFITGARDYGCTRECGAWVCG